MAAKKRINLIIVFILLSNIFFISCKKKDGFDNVDDKPEIDKKKPSHVKVPDEGLYHTIRKGDTLFHLFLKYGVDIDKISKVNNIADPTDLKIGKRVFIPGNKSSLKKSSKTYNLNKNNPSFIKAKANKIKKKSYSSKWTNKREPRVVKTRKKVKIKPIKKIRTKTEEVASVPTIKTQGTIWPIKKPFKVVRFYTRNKKIKKPTSDGIEIKPLSNSNTIHAIDDGVVLVSSKISELGNTIIISHENAKNSKKDFYSIYSFNAQNLVKTNQKVKKGQVIGRIGFNPANNQRILHFEVRQGHKSADPIKFLPSRK